MSNDIEPIRETLQFIDPSDRDKWVSMGMAIKSELADAGFDLWEAWSLQADSFNGKDARDVWKSIRAGGKVTIGTLFYEAKANGWRDDGMHQKPTPEDIAERRRIAAERAAQEEAEIARERADTAKKAAAILKSATEAKADHPYLSRKRVLPVATLREIDARTAAEILGYPPKSGGDQLAGHLLVVEGRMARFCATRCSPAQPAPTGPCQARMAAAVRRAALRFTRLAHHMASAARWGPRSHADGAASKPPDDDDEAATLTPLGEFMQRSNAELGLSVSAVAERVGMSRATWYRIAQGESSSPGTNSAPPAHAVDRKCDVA